MRRIRIAAVLLLACLLLCAGTGCRNQTSDANTAITAANAQITKYTQAGDQLEKLLSKTQQLPLDPTNAKRAIPLAKQMTVQLEAQRLAAEAAKVEIAKIKAMNVRDQFKTYADKEIAVTDTLLAEDPVAKAIVKDLQAMYSAAARGRITQTQVTTIGRRIDANTSKLNDLETRAAQQEKDASDYFDAQNLGAGK
jgi:hypothetical protein